MIYLATPYSHPDPSIREARFEAACRVAGQLMAAGQIVFSPIAHTHPIAIRCDLPKGWDFWAKYDRAMLERSSRLVVVMMEGWQDSVGIAAEIKIAAELGIFIEFMESPC